MTRYRIGRWLAYAMICAGLLMIPFGLFWLFYDGNLMAVALAGRLVGVGIVAALAGFVALAVFDGSQALQSERRPIDT